MAKKTYNFGEQASEDGVAVWQSPKFIEAKKKAIEAIESEAFKGVLTEADFWILKNKTKTGKIAYSGLIISHNGCLKINDSLPEEKRFKPSCLSLDKDGFTLDKDGYNKSLVYSYCNDEQGIYEVGEVSAVNCKNGYPYAMALKRAMDRVILKNCKLAYAGIYSDSEAEEFKAPDPSPVTESALAPAPPKKSKSSDTRKAFAELIKSNKLDIRAIAKEYKLNNESTDEEFSMALYDLEGRIERGEI